MNICIWYTFFGGQIVWVQLPQNVANQHNCLENMPAVTMQVQMVKTELMIPKRLRQTIGIETKLIKKKYACIFYHSLVIRKTFNVNIISLALVLVLALALGLGLA